MEVPITEAIHGRGRKRKREPEKWKAKRAKIQRTIYRKGKNAEMIQQSTISKGIDVKPLKLRDLRNLLQKHYGEDWKELPNLVYYKNVLFNLDKEELQLLEDNGENETNVMEDETCEGVEEDVTLRI
ncbi:unnamed protein product [Pieris macdunnoughi]|uniref:Uncharacterized protein n=1 Tax=Pieris macdunnoughi TaxID=345717 RepID=A0A821XT67_9NEOP|nr:unnamed protein product [Pieris macdunnoughi]